MARVIIPPQGDVVTSERRSRHLPRATGTWIRDQQLRNVKTKGAVALAVNAAPLDSGIYTKVDIDPEISIARDIIGDPAIADEAKKVIPVAMADGIIDVTCPWVEQTQEGDDAYIVVTVPGQDPENPTEDFLAVSDPMKVGTADPFTVPLDLTLLGVLDGEDKPFDLFVLHGSDIGNPFVSNPYKFRIDKEKPGGSTDGFTTLKLPPEYIRGGVTRSQIEADGGFRATVLAYYKFALDDEISIVFTKGDQTVVEYAAGRIPFDGTLATGRLDVLVPLDFFLDNAIDGRITVAAKAVDVAGNQSISNGWPIDTLISGAPANFGQIEVPLHDSDNLIDLADSRVPPDFIVPYYDTPVAGDRIQVIINGGSLNGGEEITVPVIIGADGDPVATGFLDTDLIVKLGQGTDGLFEFEIDYNIIRVPFSVPVNLPKVIKCDLRASGWGTELVKGVVRGPNSVEDDAIVSDDSAGPLTATIPYLALDGSDALQTNDRISLYRSMADGSSPVLIGTPQSATAGADLAYPVPAGVLQDGTNYVYYENLRAHVGGATNVERSPVWPVSVTSSNRVPGGGNPIPVTVWFYRDARQKVDTTKPGGAQPSMNYRRAHGNTADGTQFDGVILRIHHYANMAAGDKIVLTVNGYNNRLGTGVAAFVETLTYDVTPADASERPTAIPEDGIRNELPPFTQLPVPADEEKRFADIKLSYDIIRKLNTDGKIGLGSLRVSFAISNDAGTGNSDPANQIFLDVDARPPSRLRLSGLTARQKA